MEKPWEKTDRVHMILVTEYELPCGHKFSHRGNEPFELKWVKNFITCPRCENANPVSYYGIKMRQWTEQVDEP